MHAARAALIFATFPLLTSLIAAALGRERLTLSKLIGVLLTILGVGLALGEQTLQRGAVHDAWVGELAVFASAVSGAVCSVLYRPYLEKYPTLPVGAFGMVASVVFLVPLAAGEGFFASRPRSRRVAGRPWRSSASAAAAATISGCGRWARRLRRGVTAFLALSPVTAAALGAWLLGEPVSPLAALGLVSVAGDLVLAHLGSSSLAAA